MNPPVNSTLSDGVLPSMEINSQRRRLKSIALWGISMASLLLVVLIVFDILFSVVSRGIPGLNWSIFTTQTSGIAGGLQNAILGTLLLIAISMVISAPLGILGGIYIALFAPSRFAALVRFLSEVLAGVPSIVIGYFGYIKF